ncbi:MAG TPA: LacI family DNA-binding transcriptional regulator [Bryobacteraceae bacterium]|jgi:LacI family transcriptional regulator|nr:LacI family DNA-binding transcriptional regulator [Bryobacteraceae bacterium]
MKRGMSIREVAKRARVSTATVSRTINNSNLVDPGTAARVMRAVEELNYYPDTHARTLVSGRSRILGLIVSDITNPFFPELMKGFEDLAVAEGYEILVGSTNYDCTRMEICVRRMLERKVDGIAIMTSERDAPLIEQLARRRIPIAFLDVGPERKHFWNIEVNYAMGIGEAVDHLRELGHECIAFISGPQALYSAQTRREAFLAKLKTAGQAGSEPNVVEGDHTVDGGLIAMQRLLATHPRCSAVIGSNDLSAIGALRAIHRAGLRVPEDISLVGFDDIHLADFTEPPLTTIRLSRIDVATRAISWLIAEIEERQPPEKLVSPIETHLVIRQSTARVNGTKST